MKNIDMPWMNSVSLRNNQLINWVAVSFLRDNFAQFDNFWFTLVWLNMGVLVFCRVFCSIKINSSVLFSWVWRCSCFCLFSYRLVDWLLSFWFASHWNCLPVWFFLSLQVVFRQWQSCCRWTVKCLVWAAIITVSHCGDMLAWRSLTSPLET